MTTLRTAVIKKCRKRDLDERPKDEQVWCLYTHDGKKLLGRHPSEEAAQKQERAIQWRKHGETMPKVVKYRGAYYRPVEALRQQIDPSKRLPGGDVGDVVSSEFQVMQIDTWLEQAEKVFDALVASPGMEKYEDKRKAIDTNITKARRALGNLKALTGRMGEKIEGQQETIKRFQNALKELQEGRAPSAQRTSETMAPKDDTPQMVKYAGHFYVLAEDDDKKEDDKEEKEEGAEEHMEEEEAEELDLLDALKKHWQTILDKLPDDLEVDDEFEGALNGIDEVISVMDKIHEEYADEPADEEESIPEEPEAE